MHRSHSHNNRVQCQAHQASPPLTLEPYITRHYYQFRRNLELNQLIKPLPLLEEQEFWQLELNVRADLEISCMRGIDFLLTEVKRMIIVRQVLPVLGKQPELLAYSLLPPRGPSIWTESHPPLPLIHTHFFACHSSPSWHLHGNATSLTRPSQTTL